MTRLEILEIVKEAIYTVMPDLTNLSEIHEHDSLKNLGLNSIDRADVLLTCLESLALKMPLIELSKAENIGDIVDILYHKSH